MCISLGGLVYVQEKISFWRKYLQEWDLTRGKRKKGFSFCFRLHLISCSSELCACLQCVCVCVSVTETKGILIKTQKKTKAGWTVALSSFPYVLGQPSRRGCFSSWESFGPLALNPGRAQVQQAADGSRSEGGQTPGLGRGFVGSVSERRVGMCGESQEELNKSSEEEKLKMPHKKTHVVWHRRLNALN